MMHFVPTHPSVSPDSGVLNLLTIDLEDWYQLTGWVMGLPSARARRAATPDHAVVGTLRPPSMPGHVFCLGRSLEHCPHVVRAIAAAGHEIASHGFNHERLFQTGLVAFRQDLAKSLDWLGNITGSAISGYRAPCFSVAENQLEEFFDICLDAGLKYDSSVYPFRGRSYGIPSAPRMPYVARQRDQQRLIEFPMLVDRRWGRDWPIAGGGWWRLLPRALIHTAIGRCHQQSIPAVIYFHPYEFDEGFLSVKEAVGPSLRSSLWTAHQNLGRRALYHKLDWMLGRYRFGAIEDYLNTTFCGIPTMDAAD